MLFTPSLGLLTDCKRHFKHGKDSLSLLNSSVRRGHMGNRVAAAAGFLEGLPRPRPCPAAGVPHPEQGCSFLAGTVLQHTAASLLAR